jgi:predicted enzyme related to lactoylglutathione lyase
MADSTVRGRFVWHELLAADTKAAGTFFKHVYGWGTQPFAGGNGYELFTQKKTVMAGLMTLPPEAANMGAPPHWESYIGTANVDDTVRDATRLGATVLKPAADLPNNGGRFAVLLDPQGATFGVYTPPPEAPAPLGQPALGEYSWHELATTDPHGALTFYKTLFGWADSGSQDMGGGFMYHMFGLQGIPLGGVYRKPAEMQGPSNWLPYTLVADVQKTVAKIKSAGGTIINGPMEVPGGDWVAVALDARGVPFAVHARKAAPAAAPARSPAKTTPARKTPAKKVAAKKAAAMKAAAKKAPARKTASAKRAVSKARPATKAKAVKKTAKKTSAKAARASKKTVRAGQKK